MRFITNPVQESYLGAEGEGVLFGPGLGAGDGERCRPGVDGEAGRCPTGDVNFLSFCNFTKKKDTSGDSINETTLK